ncbi:tetratricopeptide repeat protein [candidate division KSB1 bacterium]|nr:tetratricopeptide repeat protein [candidate division KSB1 bacterium]
MKFLKGRGKLLMCVLGLSILMTSVGFAQQDYQEQLRKFKEDSIRIYKENQEKLKQKEEEERLNAIKKSINEGNTFVKTKQWAQALAAYNKAIEMNSEGFPKAYYGKGLALKNLRKPNEALLAYQKAVELDPSYSEAHLAMAMLYRQLKSYDYALTACKSAAKTDSTNYKVFYELGTIYNKMKKFNEAAKAFDKVTELDPTNYRAFEALGVALENSGDTNGAINAYKKSNGIKESDDVYYRLAALLNKMGRHQDALAAATRSLELESKKNGKAAFEAGLASEQLGQYQQAINYYSRAGQMDRNWKANADYQIDMIKRKM